MDFLRDISIHTGAHICVDTARASPRALTSNPLPELISRANCISRDRHPRGAARGLRASATPTVTGRPLSACHY